VGVCCPEAREILVWPGMLSQEDVSVLEALEEDLEAARLCRQRLALPREVVAVPKGIMERFGRKIDDVGVGDQVGA